MYIYVLSFNLCEYKIWLWVQYKRIRTVSSTFGYSRAPPPPPPPAAPAPPPPPTHEPPETVPGMARDSPQPHEDAEIHLSLFVWSFLSLCSEINQTIDLKRRRPTRCNSGLHWNEEPRTEATVLQVVWDCWRERCSLTLATKLNYS
jgi:hypothetical protein